MSTVIRGSRPDNIQFCFIASMIKSFHVKINLLRLSIAAIEFISIKIALHVQYTALTPALTPVAKSLNDPDLSINLINLFAGTN